jgi:signal transduction histidine kinase/CheY-like chemotaxis protein
MTASTSSGPADDWLDDRPVIRRLTLATTIAWIGFAALHASAGREVFALVHVAPGMAAATATLLTRSHRVGPRPVIALAVGGSLLALAAVAVMTGGSTAPAIAFLGLIPLIGGLLRRPAGRIVCLVGSLLVVGLIGIVTPAVPASLQIQPGPIEEFAAPIGLGLVLFAFGSAWRRSSQERFALLEARGRVIEEQWKAVDAARGELAAARDEALRASKTKSRFVAMTSHELRGPLNGILGMSHALRDTRLSPSQRDLVDTLSTSAESLAKLLQDLLDLAKIEAGHLDIVPRSYEPRELVADVVDQHAHTANAKRLEIAASTAAELPRTLVGDAGRIRQILVNLVGNAVKFTSHGSVTLRARRDGERVVFDVVDTGRGMAAEDTERIFAPFEQVSAELVDRRAGVGLGLWISRSIADQMQGRLEVVSKALRGTTFSVSLPLIPGEDSEPQMVSREPPTLLVLAASPVAAGALCSAAEEIGVKAIAMTELGRIGEVPVERAKVVVIDLDGEPGEASISEVRLRFPRSRLVLAASPQGIARAEAVANELDAGVLLKPPRATRLAAALTQAMGRASREIVQSLETTLRGTLLIVDDDAINRKVARYAAEQLGLTVEEAASAEAALVKLGERRPELALLDLHLGAGLDGVALAHQISERWPRHERPVMLGYTGSTNEVDRRRCLEAGMADVLGKPLDQTAFSAAVTQGLRKRARHSSSTNVQRAMPAVDEAVYAKLCRTVGPEIGAEILTEFLAGLDGRFDELSAAVDAHDRARLAFAAHASASVAATFGAQALATTLRRLETAAKDAPWRLLDTQMAALLRLRTESETTLRGLLAATMGATTASSSTNAGDA